MCFIWAHYILAFEYVYTKKSDVEQEKHEAECATIAILINNNAAVRSWSICVLTNPYDDLDQQSWLKCERVLRMVNVGQLRVDGRLLSSIWIDLCGLQ